MVECGRRAGLLLESLKPRRVGGKRCGENLDRDVAIQSRVAGFVDLAHPAGAERCQDFVQAEASTSGKRHELHRLRFQPTDLHEEAREVVNATLADNLPVLHVVQDRRRKAKGLASRL